METASETRRYDELRKMQELFSLYCPDDMAHAAVGSSFTVYTDISNDYWVRAVFHQWHKSTVTMQGPSGRMNTYVLSGSAEKVWPIMFAFIAAGVVAKG